jgi:small subunit ribosomal protein S3
MGAGALGVEVTIRGKLTTERARYERFKDGYLPSVGDPVLKQVKRAVVDIQLKQGLFGIAVRVLPPGAHFPDKPEIRIPSESVPEQPKRAATETEEESKEAEENADTAKA